MANFKGWVKSWIKIDPEKPQFSIVNRLILWFLILFAIPLIFKKYPIIFEFDIRITETGDLLYLRFTFRDLLDLILNGVVFPISACLLYKSLKTEIKITKNLAVNGEFSLNVSIDEFRKENNTFNWADILFLSSVFILSMGTIDHCILNNIHGHIPDSEYGSLLFSDVYFWDEHMGHMLIMVPLFVIIYIFWHYSIQLAPYSNFRWYQNVFFIVLSVGAGVAMSLSSIEGQNSVVGLFITISFLLLLIYYHISQRKKVFRNPYQIFILYWIYYIVCNMGCSIWLEAVLSLCNPIF